MKRALAVLLGCSAEDAGSTPVSEPTTVAAVEPSTPSPATPAPSIVAPLPVAPPVSLASEKISLANIEATPGRFIEGSRTLVVLVDVTPRVQFSTYTRLFVKAVCQDGDLRLSDPAPFYPVAGEQWISTHEVGVSFAMEANLFGGIRNRLGKPCGLEFFVAPDAEDGKIESIGTACWDGSTTVAGACAPERAAAIAPSTTPFSVHDLEVQIDPNHGAQARFVMRLDRAEPDSLKTSAKLKVACEVAGRRRVTHCSGQYDQAPFPLRVGEASGHECMFRQAPPGKGSERCDIEIRTHPPRESSDGRVVLARRCLTKTGLLDGACDPPISTPGAPTTPLPFAIDDLDLRFEEGGRGPHLTVFADVTATETVRDDPEVVVDVACRISGEGVDVQREIVAETTDLLDLGDTIQVHGRTGAFSARPKRCDVQFIARIGEEPPTRDIVLAKYCVTKTATKPGACR